MIFRPLSKEQLEVLRNQVLREGDMASVSSKFNYAWGLVKSNNANEQRRGVQLLTEVFKESPQRRRELLYYLAVGSYKLGDYAEARRYIVTLLGHEPENKQAIALKRMIEDRISKESLIGMGIVAGTVALGATVIAAFLKKKR